MVRSRWRPLPGPTALALTIACSPLAAQEAPTVRLTVPSAELAQPLTTVIDVRELTGGELLIVDSRRNALLRARLDQQVVSVVGSIGEGPGQYCHPVHLIPLPGDSTAVYDAARTRLLLFAPTLEPAGTMAPQLADSATLRAVLRRLGQGVADTAGRLYAGGETSERSAGFRLRIFDSVAIERWTRGSPWRADTVGYVPPPSPPGVRSAMSTPMLRPFRSRDQWTASPDGRIAIAHLGPYQIELIAADGRRLSSGPLPAEPVRVGDAERRLWTEERPYAGDGGMAPSVLARGGRMIPGRCGALGIRLGGSPRIQWPDVLPVFPTNALRFASDGLLWVQRNVPAGQPDRFDIFDRAARLAAHVVLPADTHLVGFGVRSVYAVRVDENHAQFVQQYALPHLVSQP